MLLRNDGTAVITVQTITIAPGATADVPWMYVAESPEVLADLVAGALTPLSAPEIAWGDLALAWQGTWVPPTTLVPNSGAWLIPSTLFVAPFREGRLHLQTQAGSAVLRLEASADGGTSWDQIPDLPDPNLSVGNTTLLLPKGLLLLHGTVTPTDPVNGWKGQILVALKS